MVKVVKKYRKDKVFKTRLSIRYDLNGEPQYPYIIEIEGGNKESRVAALKEEWYTNCKPEGAINEKFEVEHINDRF